MKSRAPKVATKREDILKEWQNTAKELGINFDHLIYNKESEKESELTSQSINIALTIHKHSLN